MPGSRVLWTHVGFGGNAVLSGDEGDHHGKYGFEPGSRDGVVGGDGDAEGKCDSKAGGGDYDCGRSFAGYVGACLKHTKSLITESTEMVDMLFFRIDRIAGALI